MSGQTAENALTVLLERDIGRLEPGYAPFDAVIGQGRVIRAKRRGGWAGALVAAAVVGIAAAQAVGDGAQDQASGPDGPVSVTVDVPRTDIHGQPIFSGSIGGKPWTAKVATSGPNPGCIPDWLCPGRFAEPADPVGMISGGPGPRVTTQQVIVIFRTDVTTVDLALADGDTITLRPAEYHGDKLALFELPAGYLINQVLAHSPTGDQLGIPFHTADGVNLLRQWYPAGTAPAPTVRQAVIATGHGPQDDGSKYGVVGPDQNWKATAETGPFGVCIAQQWGTISNSSCTPFQTKPLTRLPYLPVADPSAAQPFATEIDPAVDHIDVTFDNDSHTTLRPIRVGGHSFVGLLVPIGRSVIDAPSYDSTGHVLGDPAGQPDLSSKDNWYTPQDSSTKPPATKP